MNSMLTLTPLRSQLGGLISRSTRQRQVRDIRYSSGHALDREEALSWINAAVEESAMVQCDP